MCFETGPSSSLPSSRNRADSDNVSLTSQCRSTLLLDTLFILLPTAAGRGRPPRWFDVELLDGSLSTCYEKIYGSVNIKEPKTRKTTNQEAQQHVFLERPSTGTPIKYRFSKLQTQLRALAKLAPRLCAEQDHRGSLRKPLQPPHCNGKRRGVHSVLGSGVEHRSFPHTAWPLGALPSPLSVVGRKTKGKQTTHTIRAQSHWDGLWRLTHTAVAPMELIS